MPKHDERHLTTIQLSALIDNQLPEQELAICHAHLQTCRQCQGALANLKQTVGLLQALPEPALPRSFVLPGGVAYLQERPERQEEEAQQAVLNAPAAARRRLWPYYVRRSLRAASAIAAVIGLFFLLSGLLPMLPHGGGGTSTSTTGASVPMAQRASTFGPAVKATHRTATATAKKGVNGGQSGTPTSPPLAGRTPAAVHTPVRASQSQPSLPLPDLSTPLGQLEVGFTLFVLGIVGVLFTRRKQRVRQTP